MIQRWFHELGVEPSQGCLVFENNQEELQKVVDALHVCEDKYMDLISGKTETQGYIVSRKNKNASEDSEFDYIYDEFHPFKPYKSNVTDLKFTEVSGYNKTVDQFFSTLESSKFSLKIEQQKENASKRLEKAKSERDKQIESLVAQQQLNSKKVS